VAATPKVRGLCLLGGGATMTLPSIEASGGGEGPATGGGIAVQLGGGGAAGAAGGWQAEQDRKLGGGGGAGARRSWMSERRTMT
jgi:hypothetical protein